MIIGEYPCCSAGLAMETPDKTPAWREEDCPHCGAPVWHRLSRVDPMSWTKADFEAEFNIDREQRIITRKDGRDTEIRVPMREGK